MVYIYFQIPLMVLVFTPALEGLRPQLREAAVNLGATSFQYWRMVGIPLLFAGVPGVDAAAVRQRVRGLRHRRGPGQPGQPDRAAADQALLTSEILLGQQNLGFALAAEMIVVVAIVMTLYALLLRRTSRWLQ